MKIHLTPVKMAIIKKSTNIKSWRGCGGKGTPYTVGGNANWYRHYGEQCGDSLKKLEIELPYDPAIPLPDIHTEGCVRVDPKLYIFSPHPPPPLAR